MYVLRIHNLGEPDSYVHSEDPQKLKDLVYKSLYLRNPNEGWINNWDGSYYARCVDGLGCVITEYVIKKSMEINEYVPN